MSLLIQQARIVSTAGDFVGDLYAADGRIEHIAPHLDAAALPGETDIINGRGKLLFPGFIDPHVHIHLPFMGTVARETHAAASRAALAGGTTTYLEMICPEPGEMPLAAYEKWRGMAATGACDYGFHLGVTHFNEAVEQELRELVLNHGQRSFKVFLAYKGALGIDEAGLYRVCRLASELRELGAVVTAHCENAELIAQRQRELVAADKVGPQWHEASRPASVEALGVQQFCTFLQLTGARGYIVHTSSAEALDVATAFRQRGVAVDVETVVPYLFLNEQHTQRGRASGHDDFEGAKYVMSPPLRSAAQQQALWQAVLDGRIDTLATDHAPFDFAMQKHMGCPDPARTCDAAGKLTGVGGDFTMIPNGIPSIEHRADLLFTAVTDGRLSLSRFVDLVSSRAATIFNLQSKGRLAPGYDADLVLYDPAVPQTISAQSHHMLVDYSAFEGVTTPGRAWGVWRRGEAMVREGALLSAAESSRGQPVRRA